MLKKPWNTTMTEHNRKYERLIIQLTDRIVNWSIAQIGNTDKVIFFADPYFLFLIPDIHLAHCPLPANTQLKNRAKVKELNCQLLNNRLINKAVFPLIKGNNLITL